MVEFKINVVNDLGDDDKVENLKFTNLFAYQIQTTSFLLFFLSDQNHVTDAYPRVLAIQKQSNINDLLFELSKYFENFLKTFRDSMKIPNTQIYKVFFNKNAGLFCFGCNQTDCSGCEVVPSDKSISKLIGKLAVAIKVVYLVN